MWLYVAAYQEAIIIIIIIISSILASDVVKFGSCGHLGLPHTTGFNPPHTKQYHHIRQLWPTKQYLTHHPPTHQATSSHPASWPPCQRVQPRRPFQSLASWHLQLFPVAIVSSWRNETEKCQYCGLIGLQGNPLSSKIIDHQTVKFFYFSTGWIKSNMTIHQS